MRDHLLQGRLDDFLATHEALKDIWNSDGSVLLLKVLKDCNNHPGHCTGRGIQCVHKFRLYFLGLLGLAILGAIAVCVSLLSRRPAGARCVSVYAMFACAEQGTCGGRRNASDRLG